MQDDGQEERTPTALKLPSGRTVEIHRTTESISVRGSDGVVEFTIELAPEGPRLRVRAASLVLEGTESISMSAPRLNIQATEQLRISSDQRMELTAAADMTIAAPLVNVTSDGEIQLLAPMIQLN
jgi:hypothetical protein